MSVYRSIGGLSLFEYVGHGQFHALEKKEINSIVSCILHMSFSRIIQSAIPVRSDSSSGDMACLDSIIPSLRLGILTGREYSIELAFSLTFRTDLFWYCWLFERQTDGKVVRQGKRLSDQLRESTRIIKHKRRGLIAGAYYFC